MRNAINAKPDQIKTIRLLYCSLAELEGHEYPDLQVVSLTRRVNGSCDAVVTG